MTSTAQSSPSKKAGEETPIDASNLPPPIYGLHHLVNEQAAKDTWMLLLVFRCINALAVRTFFQPDEYFQSLEPAWQMAFGAQSGAWITWVGPSSLPPRCIISHHD